MGAIPSQFVNNSNSTAMMVGNNRVPSEFITVTVIPLENNLNPYAMQVEVFSDVEKNLKQVFQQEKYWGPIFRNHSPIIPPLYRYGYYFLIIL